MEGLYIGVQAVLALYAGMMTSGTKAAGLSDLTGTVLDSGDGVTHIIPVADGFVIGSCIKHIPLAGRDITRFMLSMIKDREKLNYQDLVFVTQEIKEKYGYVCKDPLEEFKIYDAKLNQNGIKCQSEKFKRHNGIGPYTKQPYSIDIGYESFLGPEMFFHPEFVNKDWRAPLDEVIDTMIQSCPIDYRRKLYGNIYLSGGSTMFPNFEKRLKKGIQTRVNERLKGYETESGEKPEEIAVSVKKKHSPKICCLLWRELFGFSAWL